MSLLPPWHATLALTLLLSAVGVTFSPTPTEAQVVFEILVDAPPARIETYPYTVYANRRVYWVDGHWYYRRGPRWYYYRSEPPPLRHHRVTVIERPHRHRHRDYHEHRRYERRHRDHHHHDRHHDRDRDRHYHR